MSDACRMRPHAPPPRHARKQACSQCGAPRAHPRPRLLVGVARLVRENALGLVQPAAAAQAARLAGLHRGHTRGQHNEQRHRRRGDGRAAAHGGVPFAFCAGRGRACVRGWWEAANPRAQRGSHRPPAPAARARARLQPWSGRRAGVRNPSGVLWALRLCGGGRQRAVGRDGGGGRPSRARWRGRHGPPRCLLRVANARSVPMGCVVAAVGGGASHGGGRAGARGGAGRSPPGLARIRRSGGCDASDGCRVWVLKRIGGW